MFHIQSADVLGLWPNFSLVELQTPIDTVHQAAAFGAQLKLRNLLADGANPDALHERSRKTPLLYAIGSNMPGLIQMLCKNGADPDGKHLPEQWPSPLVLAVELGNYHPVRVLIECGADVNRPKLSRFTSLPLHRAVEKGDARLVKLLLDSGAEPRLIDAFGFEPIHYLCAETPAKAVKIAKLLIEAGADINARAGDETLADYLSAATAKVKRRLQELGLVMTPPAA